MPRRRPVRLAGALLAWLLASGCGTKSDPWRHPAAGLSRSRPVAGLASPAIEVVSSPKPIQAQPRRPLPEKTSAQDHSRGVYHNGG